MRSITASWLSSALLGAFIALAEAQNSTSSSDENSMKIGWQDGPNQRGTLTILWSCLSTIVACTWTILHLNVPGTCDSTWRRILTKAKWMLVTLLFPEFLFSKAVCELQMAVDDLQMMSEKITLLGSDSKWEVTYRRRHRFLRNMLHLSLGSRWYAKSTETREKLPETIAAGILSTDQDYAQKEFGAVHRPSNQNDAYTQHPRKRKWTLAHSYFANMGGFERHYMEVGTCNPEEFCTEAKSNPVTAYALVNCCVGSPHDPLPELVLDRDDIEDKSKADWFLKSIAVVQISWLIVSVIDRAATHLPITQLEICSSAFGLLAIATYLANWSKPKDVGRPHQLKSILDISQCEAWKYFGEPFVRRLYRPSESGKLEDEEDAESKVARECYRIGNDFVRLDGFLPPMTVAMALSTAVFGGLHCLAWNFAFPTRTEMLIWMVASVLSATIPLSSLLVNMVVIGKIHQALSQCAEKLEDKVNYFCGAERGSNNIVSGRLQLSLTKVSESEVCSSFLAF
jgi:hypothetical protein